MSVLETEEYRHREAHDRTVDLVLFNGGGSESFADERRRRDREAHERTAIELAHYCRYATEPEQRRMAAELSRP